MTTSTTGLLAGLLLAIATAAGGIWGFVFAVLFGAIGYVVGGHYDGELDLGALIGKRNRG